MKDNDRNPGFRWRRVTVTVVVVLAAILGLVWLHLPAEPRPPGWHAARIRANHCVAYIEQKGESAVVAGRLRELDSTYEREVARSLEGDGYSPSDFVWKGRLRAGKFTGIVMVSPTVTYPGYFVHYDEGLLVETDQHEEPIAIERDN